MISTTLPKIYNQLMDTFFFSNDQPISEGNLDKVVLVKKQLQEYVESHNKFIHSERTVLLELKHQVKKLLVVSGDDKNKPTPLSNELRAIKKIATDYLQDKSMAANSLNGSQSKLLPLNKIRNKLKMFSPDNLKILQKWEVFLKDFVLQQALINNSSTEFKIGLGIIEKEVNPEKYNTTLVLGKSKNRSSDVFPFLYNQLGDLENYINASYISLGGSQYIATQGPIDTSKYSTVNDFFHMLSDVGANTVVSLTMSEENGVAKCAPWWTPELMPKEPLKDGSFLKCKTEKKYALSLTDNPLDQGLIKREFLMKKPLVSDKKEFGEEPKISYVERVITQYHLTNWADGGLPHLDVLEKLIIELINHAISGPLVVHCSVGAGRTGCFLLCYKNYKLVYELFKSGISAIRLNFLEDFVILRTQRPKMVASPEQFNVSKQIVNRLYQRAIAEQKSENSTNQL